MCSHGAVALRFSVRVNSTDMFHLDRRFWTSLRSRFPANGPRERAFHSATVIGNYMVVFGEETAMLLGKTKSNGKPACLLAVVSLPSSAPFIPSLFFRWERAHPLPRGEVL